MCLQKHSLYGLNRLSHASQDFEFRALDIDFQELRWFQFLNPNQVRHRIDLNLDRLAGLEIRIARHSLKMTTLGIFIAFKSSYFAPASHRSVKGPSLRQVLEVEDAKLVVRGKRFEPVDSGVRVESRKVQGGNADIGAKVLNQLRPQRWESCGNDPVAR